MRMNHEQSQASSWPLSLLLERLLLVLVNRLYCPLIYVSGKDLHAVTAGFDLLVPQLWEAPGY